MSTIKVNNLESAGGGGVAAKIASVNGGQLGNRNLIINGAMQVAQRGTSSTTSGYGSVDRFRVQHSGTDEAPTQAQVDVASGTTPYTNGFRKAFKITNGNQTSGAGATDSIHYEYYAEAQDIANSGWNYTSASSFITLQFWIKSSVAQNFKGRIRTRQGTSQNYAFETGSLSADTWTKITKTIPGNSNLQFDNDTAKNFQIDIYAFYGTDYTSSAVSLNTWAAYASGTQTKDNTSTWYTTNDSTLEITGVQLEVGSVATEFEHRSFNQELALCQRYCVKFSSDGGSSNGHYGRFPVGYFAGSTSGTFGLHHPPMRAVAGRTVTNGIDNFEAFFNGGGGTINPTITLMGDGMWTTFTMFIVSGFPSGRTDGAMMTARVSNRAAWFLIIDNEL